MADGSALSSGSGTVPTTQGGSQGTRTRALLILAMAVITTGTTLVSLFAIRRPLRNLVVENVSSDLLQSVATFESLRSQRVAALDRENALLADLPSLKALMTTSDERTIADGAVEFWKVSGNDLFALADRNGQIMAAFVSGTAADASFRADLHNFIVARQESYFVSGNRLFGYSVQPLYFGSRTQGTLLGYVVSGFAIDHAAVDKLGRATNVDAAFIKNGRLLASSLDRKFDQEISSIPSHASGESQTFTIRLGGENFLAVSRQLGSDPSASLEQVELKSLDHEERIIREIDRLVLLAGLLALLLGTALMVVLSRLVTRPLEQLAAGVRAFGSGDSAHLLPYRGTKEVRELSIAFGRMRREIVQANQALLESERLATIGRMASSVSHDLRHYLAAVYANSEFLASGHLPESERNDILAEIRTAVNGTTEMLESLLMFSRTGSPGLRNPHTMAALVEKSVHIAHAHPDAAGVKFSVDAGDPLETEVLVDAKQIERAIYNLLLNGCQAPRSAGTLPRVSISVAAREQDVSIDVTDNGEGVPAGIRDTLFEPFVSEGKHKGSGLGLTLTQSIAADHGGGVMLVSSRPGETVFRMSVARSNLRAVSVLANHARMGG
jgi:signal transduction histidine kinase